MSCSPMLSGEAKDPQKECVLVNRTQEMKGQVCAREETGRKDSDSVISFLLVLYKIGTLFCHLPLKGHMLTLPIF